MSKKLKLLAAILASRLKPFKDYKYSIRKAKMGQGNVDGNPSDKNYEDQSWKEVGLPYRWDSSKETWLRAKLVVPEKINQVPVTGAKISISGPSFLGDSILMAHAEMFIDGKEAIAAQNWFDLRFKLPVAETAEPFQEHIITFHIYKKGKAKDLFSTLPVLAVSYHNIDQIAFEIESFLGEISFAQFLPGGKAIVEKAVKDVGIENWQKLDIEEVLSQIEKIRNRISPLKKDAKQYSVHLVGHAHIDMNWLWGMEETTQVCKDTFHTVIKLMDMFSDFTFSQSQAFIYNAMQNIHPGLFAEIKKRVQQKRWDVTASSWVEMDLNLSRGESIVRQILYAKNYIQQELQVEPKVFWAPDTFGHPWTMPQILKKSGIDYYYFMRGGDEQHDLFWWEGPDGSKVLAFNSSYLGIISPSTVYKIPAYYNNRLGITDSMYVYGIGNHGGGPTIEDIDTVNKINSKAVAPTLKFSTTHDYFKKMSQENPKLPVVKKELNPVFDGCYTTHWDTKLHNRTCERLLIEAEITSSINKILGFTYPELSGLWHKALFNQFHDILPGSAIKESYDYSNRQAEMVEEQCREKIIHNLANISQKIKVKEYGVPLLVFNSLSWERTDLVKIGVTKDMQPPLEVIDGEGSMLPSQVENRQLMFIAENIPPLGYKVFYIKEGGKETSAPAPHGYSLENDYFILKADQKSGTISSLYDKKNDRYVMKDIIGNEALPRVFPLKLMDISSEGPSTQVVMNNIMQILYEEPHSQSSWIIGPVAKTVNLTQSSEISINAYGPVVQSLKIIKRFNKSTITQEICLYRNLEKIDFNTTIDWNEVSDNNTPAPMLRACFTPMLGRVKANYEIPFGYMERVNDGREYPALNWVDISDQEYGISLLSNLKHGFNVQGNTISVTLIRTAYEPDPKPDTGIHSFTYSLFPHKGDFKPAGTVQKGYELNHPLMAFLINNKGGQLPDCKSFIHISASNVILSCFKQAEGDENLILRVYESHGLEVECSINLGFEFQSVEEVDLMEKKLRAVKLDGKSNEFSFNINPMEIKTFKIRICQRR